MQHAAHAYVHEVLVLGEDRGLPVPGLVGRVGRHPVDAVVGEEVDPRLPLLRIEQFRLLVEELLHLKLILHVFMNCAQAFIWLRIGASDVPMFGPLSTVSPFVMSRPWWRPNVTQSPPSQDSPWWHFQ